MQAALGADSDLGAAADHGTAYAVPATELQRLRCHGRTAVVIGAGPAGLMAALTIRHEGYDSVVVLEKRAHFTRMNVVNLHPESLCVFMRLGLLERFLETASRLVDHRNYVFVDGEEMFHFSDHGFEAAVDPDARFDADDVLGGFTNETLYSINLADLQHLLATAAVERGIQILAPVEGTVEPQGDGRHAVAVCQGEARRPLAVLHPRLVVLAEGARGMIVRELAGECGTAANLWPNENWVIGNVRCHPREGLSQLLFEFDRWCKGLTISNCIYLPKRGEVNLSVTVDDPRIEPAGISELVATQAAKTLAITGVPCDRHEPIWHSRHAVRITGRSARHCWIGRNVVLVGDSMGCNSPVAALGCTLSTSAHSYALRHLVHDLEGCPEAALARYEERARACVARWHDKVAEIRAVVETDLPARSRRLLEQQGWRQPLPASP